VVNGQQADTPAREPVHTRIAQAAVSAPDWTTYSTAYQAALQQATSEGFQPAKRECIEGDTTGGCMGSEWLDVGKFREYLCQQPGITCPNHTPSPLDQALAAAASAGMIGGGRDGGQAAKSVTRAYDEALAGGRHAGFLRNYADKPTAQIERGIVSLEKQIAEHEAKIRNPAAYIDDWASLDPRQQQALLTSKWPGDIARQQEQLDILRGILGSR
jgi:hypothetical protein